MVACYLVLVRVIGPAFMKDRPPMKLNKIMVVYNGIQVMLSAFVCHQAWYYAWGGRYNYLCQPFDSTYDSYEDRMVSYPLPLSLNGVCNVLPSLFTCVLPTKGREVLAGELSKRCINPNF